MGLLYYYEWMHYCVELCFIHKTITVLHSCKVPTEHNNLNPLKHMANKKSNNDG